MIGYKAFNADMTCIGFQYEVGKTYEIEGELKICKNGFHFCENIVDTAAYYDFNDNTQYCRVEAVGKIVQEGTKYCTDKIRIIEIIPFDEIEKHLDNRNNSGDYNTGSYNSGDYNTGRYNSGDYNTGSYNSGSCNSGIFNSGRYNAGNYNSGDNNAGYYNSGNHNAGHDNSGNYNTGHYNTGDGNAGDCNTGDCNAGVRNVGNYNSGDCNGGVCNSGNNNTGNHNSGDYNSGDYNSGFFNKTTPTVRLFDKDSGLTYKEFFELGIDLRDLESSKDAIMSLPGYDPQIFFECTGIDWRENNES